MGPGASRLTTCSTRAPSTPWRRSRPPPRAGRRPGPTGHDGAVRLFDGRVVAHDAVVEMTTRAGAFHDVTFQPGDGRVLATAHSAAGCQVTEFFWFFFITEFCSKLDSSGTGFFSGWL